MTMKSPVIISKNQNAQFKFYFKRPGLSSRSMWAFEDPGRYRLNARPFALPGVPFFQLRINQIKVGALLQGPFRSHQFGRMGITGQSLNDHPRWQALEKITHQINVFRLLQATIAALTIEVF